MITYMRGDRIPEEKRDRRFYNPDGSPRPTYLLSYWRVLPDGSPDPHCEPFRTKKLVEMFHRCPPILPYQILSDKPGRKRVWASEKEYQKAYWQKRKANKAKNSDDL